MRLPCFDILQLKGSGGLSVGLSADDIKQKIAAFAELPDELLLNVPLITMTGADEMSIENFKGLIEYTDERVRVSTASGVMLLTGKRLCLKSMTRERVLVTGRISKLEFLP